jgi:hypothetical protein
MSLVYGTGQAYVTGGNVTANIGSISFVEVAVTAVTGIKDGNGSATIATVPASKKWYIVGAYLAGYGTTGTYTAALQLNGTSLLLINGMAGGVINQSWNYLQCPTIAAGQTVTLVNNNAGMTSSAGITYIEVAA